MKLATATASPEAGPDRPPKERRRDLSMMRMFVVVGPVFFHSGRVFDDGDFYVRDDPPSELATMFLGSAATWGCRGPS